MTKNEINAYLAIMVQAIGEGIPSGHLYAAMMGKIDLHNYQAFLIILVQSGLVESSQHYLTLTEKGSKMAAEIQALEAEMGVK